MRDEHLSFQNPKKSLPVLEWSWGFLPGLVGRWSTLLIQIRSQWWWSVSLKAQWHPLSWCVSGVMQVTFPSPAKASVSLKGIYYVSCCKWRLIWASVPSLCHFPLAPALYLLGSRQKKTALYAFKPTPSPPMLCFHKCWFLQRTEQSPQPCTCFSITL